MRENPAAVPELLLIKLGVYWNPQVTPLRNLRQGEKLAVDNNGDVVIISGEGSHIGVTAANAAYERTGFLMWSAAVCISCISAACYCWRSRASG